MRWSIKSPGERGRFTRRGQCFQHCIPHQPQTGVIQPKRPSWGPRGSSSPPPTSALRHRAGGDPGWPGVHWLILNRQKCIWLTFVLLMFHSVFFFPYHGNFNITTKHLLFLSEPSLLSCPVGYFSRQGLFFSSGGVPISYQIPPPVFPVLRRFSLCEHCFNPWQEKRIKLEF